MTSPIVSVIVPCRNEQDFIRKCLESLYDNSLPRETIEILVVDGGSTDNTQDVVRAFARDHEGIRLLTNPRRSVPCAMNLGIRQARGAVIVKADAHSIFAPDYLTRCLQYLDQFGADNVGGVLSIVPPDGSTMSAAIVEALTHPIGNGNAPHLNRHNRAPRFADTAAFGCYRRGVFDHIGLYNEELDRSSDMDLNVRLRHAGGKILLVPDLVIEYVTHPGYGSFLVRNFNVGFWVMYALKFGGRALQLRHAAPLALLLGAVAGFAVTSTFPAGRPLLEAAILTYVLLIGAVSVRLAIVRRKFALGLCVPLAFATRHLMYAFGSLCGVVSALASPRFWCGLRHYGREVVNPAHEPGATFLEPKIDERPGSLSARQ
jgi:glycosyltransferase involved in cell wall biosynthesis